MIATTERRYSLDEYRAIAETSEERCEYYDGKLSNISGVTVNHSRIGGSILLYLHEQFEDTEFEVFKSNLRLWIPKYCYGVYPDIMVFKGNLQLNADRDDEVLNPILIADVLYPKDKVQERPSKFHLYRSILSFSEYLLIRQDKVCIEHYWKQDRNWILQDFDSLDQSISLKSVNIELVISEIYRKINF
ncbi:MAG: Uma2 family endonuclease [Pseudanabaena sp. CAN_BIN31]|nr:Uma2 family endonuclease [Pseudanabaena sp. CAN_BIN31]